MLAQRKRICQEARRLNHGPRIHTITNPKVCLVTLRESIHKDTPTSKLVGERWEVVKAGVRPDQTTGPAAATETRYRNLKTVAATRHSRTTVEHRPDQVQQVRRASKAGSDRSKTGPG
jgi:hypothetical protein